jgi:MarR family transcriptional regulator for hemolysin
MLFALARKEGPQSARVGPKSSISRRRRSFGFSTGMEKQGFIERRVELSDRRAKQIHMTDVGPLRGG